MHGPMNVKFEREKCGACCILCIYYVEGETELKENTADIVLVSLRWIFLRVTNRRDSRVV